MREIIFRGKRKDNGEWEYGYLTFTKEGHAIVNTDGMGLLFVNLVREETIGQFTGAKDRNGVEIYEGDIWKGRNGVTYVVAWHQRWVGYALFYPESEMYYGIPVGELEMGEVIGNIYENPELLITHSLEDK